MRKKIGLIKQVSLAGPTGSFTVRADDNPLSVLQVCSSHETYSFSIYSCYLTVVEVESGRYVGQGLMRTPIMTKDVIPKKIVELGTYSHSGYSFYYKRQYAFVNIEGDTVTVERFNE